MGGAWALAARLRVLPRRESAEREALERLAAWCGRFSSEVSLEPPRGLILEAARSLNLFGGAWSLLDQVSAGVAGLGYRCRCCLAPTPGGALVLATAGEEGVIVDAEALRTALSGLPLRALELDESELRSLRHMGLRTVGDLLRLPRTGLTERLGPARILQLQRLLGEAPDPRSRFEPPATYRGRLELPSELLYVDALLFPCRRLIDEVAGFLLSRGAGVQRLEWCLEHPEGTEHTRFTLGSARAEQDPGRWLGLLRERLERLRLPAPVCALGLSLDGVQPLTPVTRELFPELEPALAPDSALLDRLRARLGRDAVRGLSLVADHRPERAWRWCSPGESGKGEGRGDRPLWLLPEPRPLETRRRRPWMDGDLDLGVERERIETGWWDGLDVARDYFVATRVRGERLWIYREIQEPHAWFLHGLFG